MINGKPFGFKGVKTLLDMDGCTFLGRIKTEKGGNKSVKYKSICWDCEVPVGKCLWLLYGIPYEGSTYYARVYFMKGYGRFEGRGTWGSIYSIQSCPRFKKGE